MASKNISISKGIYEALLREKREGESFTDVIFRLLTRRKRLSDSFGSWEMSDKELRSYKRELESMWKKWAAEIAE